MEEFGKLQEFSFVKIKTNWSSSGCLSLISGNGWSAWASCRRKPASAPVVKEPPDFPLSPDSEKRAKGQGRKCQETRNFCTGEKNEKESPCPQKKSKNTERKSKEGRKEGREEGKKEERKKGREGGEKEGERREGRKKLFQYLKRHNIPEGKTRING